MRMSARVSEVCHSTDEIQPEYTVFRKPNVVSAEMEELADLFKAMAHPTRLQILRMLRQGELCVCHIENALDRRQPYISQQLMVLRDSGAVESRRDGLQVYYRIRDPRVNRLLDAALDDSAAADFAPLPDCSCPACTAAALIQID